MHATMEHMTIWSLISDASLLVKAVMVTLLLASLLSWYLIIQRSGVLRGLEQQLNGFLARFRVASDLQPLYRETVQAGEGGVAPILLPACRNTSICTTTIRPCSRVWSAPCR